VGIEFFHNAVQMVDTVDIILDISWSSAPDDGEFQPVEFGLNQNYPNPFNSITNISYALEKESAIQLNIFDISGRLIYELQDVKQTPGRYRIAFDASKLATGIYLVHLKAGGKEETKKMVLIR